MGPQTCIPTALVLCFVFTANARIWLEAPKVANCRDSIVLTCHYCDTPLTNWTWSRKFGVWETFMVNGTQTGRSGAFVREEMNGWFSLIIDNADNKAVGLYRCGVGEYQSEGANLMVECKPKHADVRLLSDRRIEITMKTVFPIPKINFKLTDDSSKTSSVSFNYPTCRGISWIQDCTWISTTPLADGRYSYSLAATTMTETVFYGHIN